MVNNRQLLSLAQILTYFGTLTGLLFNIAIYQLIDNIIIAALIIAATSIGTIALFIYFGVIIKSKLKLTDIQKLENEDYIQNNISKNYTEDGLAVKLAEDSQYPVVIGLRSEENIGELVNTNRELQPGQEAVISRETDSEITKEETLRIEYENTSTDLYTEVEDEHDGYFFINIGRKPKNTTDILESFSIEKGDTQ